MIVSRQLQILRVIKSLLYYPKFQNGICGVLLYQFQTSRITKNEYVFIRNLLEENKPTPDNQYKIFTENEYWITKSDELMTNNCWWVRMEDNSETRKIRIDYLSQMIFNLINQS